MLHINLTKNQTSIGLRMGEAFLACCNQLTMEPFEELLDEIGIRFFDFPELCAFMDDMTLSFYQRLVRLEDTGAPYFTARQITTGCSHRPSEKEAYLFEYLDHQHQWIPELNMAFHLHHSDEQLLTGISRCYLYEGYRNIKLTHILTSPEGKDYYPGDMVPYGWIDRRDREVLKIQLMHDREQYKANHGK